MRKWAGAMQVAAVYVGTVIGAGFATGKEIVEFFTRFGFIGIISILIAGYLFIALGSKIMVKAIDLKADSYEVFNQYLFGKTISKFMNIFMMFMLLGVCGVMFSGAGAVFEEHLGINKNMGIYITIALTIFIMLIGTKGVFAVNTFVVPMMIIFNFFIMTHVIVMPNFSDAFFHIPELDNGWKGIFAPFSYAALNLILAQAVLVPIAYEVNDKDIVHRGGIIGGALLTLILLSSHFTLITLPNVTQFDIPMATIVQNTFGSIYFIYVAIIYGEIFTSIIGNIYGLGKQMQQYISIHTIWIYIGIIIIVLMISKINYGTLLSYLYPLFGYISLVFMILLWIKNDKGPKKI
ncbi:YkvI family membrane protein [Heyndrickxia sp. NPDC080065]|uniref:YkvI family membrane protein n=1 Tax=Heyndrickxia sp. NPDC080065 TaxID=3390568 RepID=UPI003CFF0037